MPIIAIKIYWKTFSNSDRNNFESSVSFVSSQKERTDNCKIALRDQTSNAITPNKTIGLRSFRCSNNTHVRNDIFKTSSL